MMGYKDIEVQADKYETIQEINLATNLLEKEYLNEEEYEVVMKIYPEEEVNMVRVDNLYGIEYLNINVFNKIEKDFLENLHGMDLINWQVEQFN